MKTTISLAALLVSVYALFSQETKKDEYKIRRNGKPVDFEILGKKVNVYRVIVIAISIFVITGSIITLLKK